MHELSLSHSILQIVDRARAGREVETVHLQVGQLRQVVPETLVYCWGLVVADTALAGAELVIDHVPVLLSCNTCGAQTPVEHALVLTCSACGSGAITVLTGEEFLVTSLDLRPLATPPPPPATDTPILEEHLHG